MAKWVPVPGYEGLYSVSSRGTVRSEPRRIAHYRGGESVLPARELKPDISATYYRVTLCREGKTTRESIHRLVCEAFHGPAPEGKPWVLHKNGNPRDNRAENLYWGTPKENMQDKIRHGRNHELNKTHCPQGHPFAGDNLYIVPSSGKRQCRACARARKEANRDAINKRRRELRRERRSNG